MTLDVSDGPALARFDGCHWMRLSLCLKRPSFYCLIHFYKRCVSSPAQMGRSPWVRLGWESVLSVTTFFIQGLRKPTRNEILQKREKTLLPASLNDDYNWPRLMLRSERKMFYSCCNNLQSLWSELPSSWKLILSPAQRGRVMSQSPLLRLALAITIHRQPRVSNS